MSAIAHYFLDTLSDNFNCSSIPPPCGWNANCNDTEEGPMCYCDIGYWINSTTNECESKLPLKVFTVHCSHDAMTLFPVCPWGTWGEDCAYECNCTNLDNTTTCHRVNGSCPDDGKTHSVKSSPRVIIIDYFSSRYFQL